MVLSVNSPAQLGASKTLPMSKCPKWVRTEEIFCSIMVGNSKYPCLSWSVYIGRLTLTPFRFTSLILRASLGKSHRTRALCVGFEKPNPSCCTLIGEKISTLVFSKGYWKSGFSSAKIKIKKQRFLLNMRWKNEPITRGRS